MTIDLWPDLWAIVAATYVPQQRVQKGPIQGTRKPKSIDTHMVKLIYAHFICWKTADLSLWPRLLRYQCCVCCPSDAYEILVALPGEEILKSSQNETN